jgi:hypothetical protein
VSTVETPSTAAARDFLSTRNLVMLASSGPASRLSGWPPLIGCRLTADETHLRCLTASTSGVLRRVTQVTEESSYAYRDMQDFQVVPGCLTFYCDGQLVTYHVDEPDELTWKTLAEFVAARALHPVEDHLLQPSDPLVNSDVAGSSSDSNDRMTLGAHPLSTTPSGPCTDSSAANRPLPIDVQVQCANCLHLATHRRCSAADSPMVGEVVNCGDSCDSFAVSEGQILMAEANLAVAKSQAEDAMQLWHRALECDLPVEEQVFAKKMLGHLLLSNGLIEGIPLMEQALALDKDEDTHSVEESLNLLFPLDDYYSDLAWKSMEGAQGTADYLRLFDLLREKVSQCDYLPVNPLLHSRVDLAVLMNMTLIQDRRGTRRKAAILELKAVRDAPSVLDSQSADRARTTAAKVLRNIGN